MKARVKFQKTGNLRFIGHLDVMRYFQKVIRRAELPIAYSEGYSPHMIMSFANPLGIGLTSEGEYVDIELTAPVNSREAVQRMNAVSVDDIRILSVKQIADEKKMNGMTILAAADYLVTLRKGTLPADWKSRFAAFMEQNEIKVIKKTKRSEKEVDIRPLIYVWELRGDAIYMLTAAGSVQNLKPSLVMETFSRFAGIGEADAAWFYHRLDMYANAAGESGQAFVPLDQLGWEM